MKIVYKIAALVIFLLMVLGANTFIGLKNIANIKSEFFAMANYDVALMEDVSAIHQLQLEKGIFLQRLISITEELGFEKINPARRQYLDDQLSDMGKAFDRTQIEISSRVSKAKEDIGKAMSVTEDDHKKSELVRSMHVIGGIEQGLSQYDALIAAILKQALKGGYQVSLEDLEQLQLNEGAVTSDVKVLLGDVQGFVHASMSKTDHWQQEARNLLLISLGVSAVVALILLIWIIFSIASFNALNKKLSDANQELDKFIQVMAQDIVNPLTGVIAYCAYIETHAGTAMDAKNAEALSGIRRASTKMHGLVKDLIKFAESKRLKS